MRIRYIGHSCFAFETKGGVRLVIDPYDNSIGLTPVRETADMVLVTHHHFDHDYVQGVQGEYTLVDSPGEYQSGDVRVTGYTLPHDSAGGSERGFVTAYLIEADGLRILHMGDVGGMPDDSFFDAVGRIDVLLIPVGGRYTVDAEGALAICERIRPNLMIPMHYKTHRLKIDIDPVTPFVTASRSEYDIQRQGDVLVLDGDTKKKRGRVILMENSF
ncbi:MAG: MBL fold metallo-hydrolase [Clostridia bacterium]|nr:MBL fold metallo-hydrolase [Clostridia bacterium]